MNDITPRGSRGPLSPQSKVQRLSLSSDQMPATLPQPAEPSSPTGLKLNDVKSAPGDSKSKKSWLKWTLLALLGLVIVAVVAAYALFQYLLSPVSSDKNSQKQIVQVTAGQSPRQIAATLEQKRLIRSAQAFYIQMTLAGQSANLKAGSYSLSPSQSSQQILATLTSGKVDQISVTIFPGSTLGLFDDSSENQSVISSLRKSGFSDDEINTAFTTRYSVPGLFASKPAGTSLIGYIYGETYTFPLDSSATTVVERSLRELASVIKQYDLVAKYKKQGLSLYEGITLASIVQREVTDPEDEKKVAGIFLERLRGDISLGSDVTYEYAAKLLGKPATPDLESPYNTRKEKGLPPGPISNPGLSALLAVAEPIKTDYLYFLSGDDGKTYFATTNEQHEANVQKYCRQKCQL